MIHIKNKKKNRLGRKKTSQTSQTSQRNNSEKTVQLPVELQEYQQLEIMKIRDKSTEEKRYLKIKDSDIMILGCEASEEEKLVLSFSPRTATNQQLNLIDLREGLEIAHTKARYKILGDLEQADEGGQDVPDTDVHEADDQPDEELEQTESEVRAQTRLIYDVSRKTFNFSKRKTTDIKGNNKVYLPPPLQPIDEIFITIRTEKMLSEFKR